MVIVVTSNQVTFRISLPDINEKKGKFYLYLNNRGQSYVPNRRGLFGSAIKTLARLMEGDEGHKKDFEFDFHLKKIVWKTLSTEKMPCDEHSKYPDTTGCITTYLERVIGCSMKLLGGDPNLSRYARLFPCFL